MISDAVLKRKDFPKMLAGMPYAGLRDAVLAHPTMAEGLSSLFSEVRPS
jgi:hypothetical protein